MLKTFTATLAAVLFMGSFVQASEGMLPVPTPKTAFAATDALAEAAKYDMGCNESMPADAERITVSFKYSYEDATAPMREQGYFIVTCMAGAYNSNSVLLTEDTYGGVLRPVPLAAPMMNSKGKLVGFTAEIVTGHLSFDKTTNQLSTFSKGRGIGDMYVHGVYQLFETQVILREYTIDNVEGDNVEVKPIFKSTQPIDR